MISIKKNNIVDDNEENTNIIYYNLKNIKYYKSLYNLIFLYINELNELNTSSNLFDDDFDPEFVKNIIKKIENYINLIDIDSFNFDLNENIKITLILNILKLLKLNERLFNILNIHIQLINEINIFDKKILMSDTSKNNINKNKLHILDIYNNFIKHISNNNNLIIDQSVIIIKNILILEDSDINSYIDNVLNIIDIINKYFNKNIGIIDFFILFSQSMTGINNILNDYLYIINENNKQFVLEYELAQKNIKFNKNINIKLVFNNLSSKKTSNDVKDHILKNNINIVKTYNRFKYSLSFNSLNKLLSSIDINVKILNKFNKDTFTILNKALALYEKTYKHKLIIVILECKLDPIIYDISKLIDNSSKLEKLSGINDNYIKKTNTILESSKHKNDMNIYISNIQKTYIINSSINYNKKSNNIEIDYNTYNSKTILIHTYDNNSYNLLYNDTSSNYKIDFKDVLPIIQNQPNYNIENYNSLIEDNILNKIESKNILDEYYKTIKLDIHTYKLENTLEIKNNIINDISKNITLEFTYDNKNIIIDQILNIIIDNISKYIKNKNKIEYDAETYLTYLSSVNGLINKFKKEIVDNYEDFINNIDKIIENIYTKILKINDNIIDKYYYTHIIE